MWKNINDYVEKHHMLSDGDRILIGLSGGADSILLARYLLEQRKQKEISLYAVHVNHLLRGEEADRDEQFVVEFCEEWQIPCRIIKRDVRQFALEQKCSEEEAGRMIRYEAFAELSQEWGCNKIALAHHGTDLTETMIFRMIRGTGPEGIPGILPNYDHKIRPLLFLEKEQILTMLSQLKQAFVEDSSNGQTVYTRNYIRHEILPRMKKVNQNVVDHFVQLSEQMREQNDYVREQMDHLYEKYHIEEYDVIYGVRLPLPWLRSCQNFVKKEMLRRMLFQVAGYRKDIGALHVELLLQLLDRKVGRSLNLPYKVLAVLEEEYLYLVQASNLEELKNKTIGKYETMETYDSFSVSVEKLESGETISLMLVQPDRFTGAKREVCYTLQLVSDVSEKNLKKQCENYLDYDKIKGSLCFRKRRSGDYLIMNQDGRKKKLNRYMIDEKIPATLRDEIYFLCHEDHVLWIPQGRISESCKVTGESQRILKILFE